MRPIEGKEIKKGKEGAGFRDLATPSLGSLGTQLNGPAQHDKAQCSSDTPMYCPIHKNYRPDIYNVGVILGNYFR